MITLIFEKTGAGVYLAHTDILRNVIRTFRRAGISMNYSKGFSPHMRLYLNQPLPFGTASISDFVTADTEMEISEKEIIELFNKCAPSFLRAKRAYFTKKNPKLSGKISACRYVVSRGKSENLPKEFLEENKEKILELRDTEQGLECALTFGLNNMRIDAFTKALNLSLTAAFRTAQLIEENGKLITVEEYLKACEESI